jgi:hypothetical protein
LRPGGAVGNGIPLERLESGAAGFRDYQLTAVVKLEDEIAGRGNRRILRLPRLTEPQRPARVRIERKHAVAKRPSPSGIVLGRRAVNGQTGDQKKAESKGLRAFPSVCP